MAVNKLAKTIVVKNVHLVVIVIARAIVVEHVLDVQEPVKKVQQAVICVWIALVLVMLHVQRPAQALVIQQQRDVPIVRAPVRTYVVEIVQVAAQEHQKQMAAKIVVEPVIQIVQQYVLIQKVPQVQVVKVVIPHVILHVQQYAREIVQVHVAQAAKKTVLAHVLATAQALVIHLV